MIRIHHCFDDYFKAMEFWWYSYSDIDIWSDLHCFYKTKITVYNSSAKAVNDQWRGANTPGTGHADRTGLLAGWYKFTSHGKKIANYPVPKNYCGADFPLWMNDNHAEKGSCGSKVLSQVHSNTYWWWRTVSIHHSRKVGGECPFDYTIYDDTNYYITVTKIKQERTIQDFT